MVESDTEDGRSVENEGCSSIDDTSSSPDDSDSCECGSSKSIEEKVEDTSMEVKMQKKTIKEKVENITKKLAEDVLK